MTKETTVALVGTDAQVPEILSALEVELKNLKAITDKPYRTTGNLTGFGDIKSETKVENLVRAFSMVRGKEDAYNAAAKELEIKTFPTFNIDGGSADDWKQDIQTRLAVIQYEDRKNTLQNFQTEMSKFLSAEDQKVILLGKMQAYLGTK